MKAKIFFAACVALFVVAVSTHLSNSSVVPAPKAVSAVDRIGTLLSSGASTTSEVLSPTKIATAYWEKRIRQVGDVQAYKELAATATAQSSDIQIQHNFAHEFGGALYTVEGLKGLSVCDDQFLFGCFHQLTGQAFVANGLPVLSKLQTECEKHKNQKDYNMCEHGVGHGIIEFLGYDLTHLKESLKLCDTLIPPPGVIPALDDCHGGVFMEYNGRSALGGGIYGRQPDDKEGFLFPCNLIADAYKNYCYLKQPRWWVTTYLHYENTVATSQKMGTMCNTITDSTFRRACYAGIGIAISGPAQEDPKKGIAMCNAATKDTADRLLCVSFSAFAASASGDSVSAHKLCSELDTSLRPYCNIYANGESYFTIVPLPQGIK